jgi:hypothetical protein
LSPTGKGSAQALAVTITGQVGTGAAAFTYNAPVVTRNNVQNSATTGYGSVIVEGTNFGPAVINEQDQVGRPILPGRVRVLVDLAAPRVRRIVRCCDDNN